MTAQPYEKWNDQVSWQLLLPPGRPSPEHLRFTRRALEGVHPGALIGLLGATPEIRDLLWEMGLRRVMILDRNSAFVERMTRLRVYKGASNEHVEIGDWVELLARHPRSFGAVISDLTLGNIAYEDRGVFFHRLAASLTREGIFIDKVLTCEAPPRTLDELDKFYSTQPLNLITINRFTHDYFFLSTLPVEAGRVEIPVIRDRLQSRFNEAPRLLALLNASLDLVTSKGLWCYGRPWPEVSVDYFRDLELVTMEWEQPPSEFAGSLRLQVSRRKLSNKTGGN